MTRHILVTGGMGFIGSHLVRELIRDREAHVTIVDDLSSAVLEADRILVEICRDRAGEVSLSSLPVADWEHDALDREKDFHFETIYHLASIVGPAAVLKKAGYIAQSILRDTYVAIRAAQRCGARLVNVSTSEVYGGGLNGLCREDSPRVIRGPASARQEYAAGKLAAEVAVENLCRLGQLDAVTIRPFNVAGIRQSGRGGFVLPRFIGQAILEEPLTVFGDGSQLRAFTDARDVAAGMLFCAEHGKSGQTYNVENPASRTSITGLAEQVIAVTGSRSQICHVDPKELYGETYAGAPDKFPDSGALMDLGWRPLFSLTETIRDTYLAMRELPEDELLALAGLAPEQSLMGASV